MNEREACLSNTNLFKCNSQVAWTPQQDLEETSSDGGLDSAPVSPQSLDTTQFSRTRTIARPSFCLSLPRDENTGLDKRYGQMVCVFLFRNICVIILYNF